MADFHSDDWRPISSGFAQMVDVLVGLPARVQWEAELPLARQEEGRQGLPEVDRFSSFQTEPGVL